MLEKTRSLNNSERAQQITLCCIADARGRTGFEDRNYMQADLFLKYQQAANEVNCGEIAKGKKGGSAIQAAIREARLANIKSLKMDTKATYSTEK